MFQYNPYIFFPIIIAIHDLVGFILSKKLTDIYSFKKIALHSVFFSFFIMLFLWPEEIYIKLDRNYFYFLIGAANTLFGLWIWFNVIKRKMNLGKVDGLSIAFYLPLLTIGSAIIFKEKMSLLNWLGILFLIIGANLTLKKT